MVATPLKIYGRSFLVTVALTCRLPVSTINESAASEGLVPSAYVPVQCSARDLEGYQGVHTGCAIIKKD